MQSNAPFFWMNGILATDLMEITSDLSRIGSEGFWVVVITFEGQRTFARFATVQREQPFPATDAWSPLRSTWKSSLTREQYYSYVEEIRRNIAQGVVYQANACRVLSTPFDNGSLDSLFAEILQDNAAPYASFLRLSDIEIASASPELFLRKTERDVVTSPIKGTQDSRVTERFGLKDQSENIMIVDLMRNDLSRICETGSVEVSDFLRTELHPGIRHLVSDVRGTLRDGITWEGIFQGLLPAGSISGAPKLSALEIIATNEPVARGIYCGLIGWIEGGESQLALGIRTFWSTSQTLHFGTGAGITWPSDPHLEWRETELKANRLISIAGGVDGDGWPFGAGIFETLLLKEGVPLLFERHMQRAESSATELGIKLPSRGAMQGEIAQLTPPPLARVRLCFGKQFSLAMAPYERSGDSLKVRLLTNQPDAGIGRHKNFPYSANLDLLRSAQFEGFDEVLLVDESGVVGEGATCNFLFYLDGHWVTPPLSSGVFPGVMRELALENAIAREGHISLADLDRVQSMMALSSLRIASPVSTLDERELVEGPECDLIFETMWSLAQSDSVG